MVINYITADKHEIGVTGLTSEARNLLKDLGWMYWETTESGEIWYLNERI